MTRERWFGPIEEHMDRADAAGPDLDTALDDLARINRLLGGHRCARRGLTTVLGPQTAPGQSITVLDIGCGSGDLAPVVAGWAAGRGLRSRTVLVDFNLQACRRAREHGTALRCDARHLPFLPRSFDVVHCGLFLHHFEASRAALLLRQLLGLCRKGLILNDLHRHPVSLAAVWLGVRCLPCSPMVRHDGPLSVRRGFRRWELEEIGSRAGFAWTVLRRSWPFRWMAVKRLPI